VIAEPQITVDARPETFAQVGAPLRLHAIVRLCAASDDA
jgi:hypothetical protein